MNVYPIIVIFLTASITALEVCAQLSISNRESNSSQIELNWPSQIGQSYKILESSDLTSANSFTIVSSGQQGTPPQNTWWVDRAESGARFYKLAIIDSTGEEPTSITTNGDFTTDSSNWNQLTNSEAIADFSVSNGELFVDITNGGDAPFNVLVNQLGIALSENQDYTLLFDARATAERPLRVKVEYVNNDTIADLNGLVLNQTMRNYRLAFTHTGADINDGKIKIFLGADDAGVYLDNIRLLEGSVYETRTSARTMNDRLHRGNSFMASKALNDQGALEDYQLLNTSGFSHCRIGYKMDEVAGIAPNYTLPNDDLRVLQKMVDWCIQEGLIAVIDPVHNWANNNNQNGAVAFAGSPEEFDKLGKIWEQVADHFADYSLTDVVYEVFNEPHDLIDTLGRNNTAEQIITTSLASIRSSEGNEKRIVIVPGDGFTTRQALIDAFSNDKIPTNDPYLIATFHYYDPKSFTKISYESAPGQPAYNPVWGTTAELNLVATDFDAVVTANNNWAARNFTEPLPVYLGEFGVDNEADTHGNDRKKWLSWIRMQAEARNMSWAHWNMYQNEASAKGMGAWTQGSSGTIPNPSLRAFDPDPVEALVGHYEFEDGSHGGGVSEQSVLPGYKDRGYKAFPESIGAGVWAQAQEIYVPATGTYEVKIHYSSAEARNLRVVSRNDLGTAVETIESQLFPATISADSWSTLSVNLNLEAGDAASIRIVATPDTGVNLDWVEITLP